MKLLLLFAYWFLIATSPSLAALFESIDHLPTDRYDIIIVGGGAAGSVLGNRLSASRWRVLVIESGPSSRGVLEQPLRPVLGFFSGNSPLVPYDWNSTSVPQPILGNRTVCITHVARPRTGTDLQASWVMLVGRGMQFSRTYEGLNAGQNERWTPPVDNSNTSGRFNPAFHSTTGMNAVSLAGWPQGLDPRVVQTMNQLPQQFPFVLDYNAGNPLGLGYLQMTVDRGRRSSAATSYLSPLFTSRPNLDVVVNSRVVRIVQTGVVGGRPHFGAVEVVNRNGRVIGTPQLLLLSGIGDATDLRRVGIPPLVQLQDVGRNFHDDPLITITYHATAGLTMDDIKNSPAIYNHFMSEWSRTNTGPFAAISNSFINWGRVPDSSPIWNTFRDPAAGRNTPHYGQYPLNGGPYPGGQYLTMLSLLVTPISRGTVSLRTSNPFDQPLIDPRYLSSKFDLVAMIEAVRNSQRFIAAPAWRGYVLRPVA
ncbi:hypothetical protein H0H93_001482, partial [Arthromyces matolae]